MMEDDFTLKVAPHPSDLTQFRKKNLRDHFLQIRVKGDPQIQKSLGRIKTSKQKRGQHHINCYWPSTSRSYLDVKLW